MSNGHFYDLVKRMLEGSEPIPDNIKLDFIFTGQQILYDHVIRLADASQIAIEERAKMREALDRATEAHKSFLARLDKLEGVESREGKRERATDNEPTERVKAWILDKAAIPLLLAALYWFLFTILPQLIKGLP